MTIQTVSVDEAALLLGIGRQTAYEAVREGRIPSLRIGARRLLVPVGRLADLLGADPETLRNQIVQLRGAIRFAELGGAK